MFARRTRNNECGSNAGKYRSARKQAVAFFADTDRAIRRNLREHAVAERWAEHRYRAQIRLQKPGESRLHRGIVPRLHQHLGKPVDAVSARFSAQKLRELAAVIRAHAFARVKNERTNFLAGQRMDVAVDRLG